MATPIPSAHSPFLKIVDKALSQAQRLDGAASERGGGVRGGLPGATLPTAPPHDSQSATDQLFGQLGNLDATVSSQIAAVRAWLQTRPAMLQLLDDALHQEFAAMEQRLRRNTFVQNVAFMVAGAVLGAVIGLLLPVLLSGLHVTSPFAGH